MKTRFSIVCILTTLFSMPMFAAEQAGDGSVWVRLTVLLEPGSVTAQRASDTVIPGGSWSVTEAARLGRESVDAEILKRADTLAGKIRDLQKSMRLGTLMVRQFQLHIELGHQLVLPVLDLNPDLGIIVSLVHLDKAIAAFNVEFRSAEEGASAPEFSCQPVTLTLMDADVVDVLKTFSMLSDRRIIVDPTVKGSVSVELRDVPWDQALDLILRINGLGWEAGDDKAIRVAPLAKLNREKPILAKATVSVERGSGRLAMVAGRDGEVTPTVVLLVEVLDEEPPRMAKLGGMVKFGDFQLPAADGEEAEASSRGFVIVRGTVSAEGTFDDVEVLQGLTPEYNQRLRDLAEQWRLKPILDERGHRQPVVVGFGVPMEAPVVAGIPENLGFDIWVRSFPGEPDQVLINVVVTDLDSGRVVFAPKFRARVGEEARLRSGFMGPGGEMSEFTMQIEVAEDGSKVTYKWEAIRGDTVLTSHSAKLEL